MKKLISKVQVVGSDGQKIGELPIAKAIELAEEEGLDLVLVSPNPENPVCKILDYSKYKFEMNKKAKESKKKQKVVEVKEVRISPNIDKHDLEVKAKNANKFIDAAQVDKDPKMEGKNLIMFLVPKQK